MNTTISSSTDWANNASKWASSATDAVSNSAHPAARKLTEFDGSLISQLQTIANGSATTTTWGLRAASESSDSGWKKFDAKTAKLIVTVNSAPAAPTTLTVDGKGCVKGATRPFVATATPALRAKVTDPDGDSMSVTFTWAKGNAAGTTFTDTASKVNTPVTNGGTAVVTTGTLVTDGIYAFRAQANDDPSVVNGVKTGPSSTVHGCEFQVDLVDPVAPTVVSDVYKAAGCPEDGCGAVGQTGRFTISSSADVKSFKWGFTTSMTSVATPAALGGSVTIEWTPTSGGPKTLYTQAVDRAGRIKNGTYQFYVAGPSPAKARWLLNDATEQADEAGNPVGPVARDDTGLGNTASVDGATLGVPGRITPGKDGQPRTAARFSGTNAAITAPAVVDTSKSYSVSAWVKLADTSTNHLVANAWGSDHSAFYLWYTTATNRWVFETTSNDNATGYTYSTVTSDAVPVVGAWTHLTGVYDSGTDQLYLYGVAAIACSIIPPLQVAAPFLGAASTVLGAIDTYKSCSEGEGIDCGLGVVGLIPGGRALKALGDGLTNLKVTRGLRNEARNGLKTWQNQVANGITEGRRGKAFVMKTLNRAEATYSDALRNPSHWSDSHKGWNFLGNALGAEGIFNEFCGWCGESRQSDAGLAPMWGKDWGKQKSKSPSRSSSAGSSSSYSSPSWQAKLSRMI
ncbi:LamG domain-containing protein [Luedemannella flava]